MPCLQIVEGNRADGGQLRLAGVGRVGAVDELGGFAAGDLAFIVVAADDARGHLLLGELELFGGEFGMKKQVHSQREDLVGVGLERVPGERRGIDVAGGFDVRGLGFEQVVEGVAARSWRCRWCARSAIEIDEAGFGGVFIARAAGESTEPETKGSS